jgi:hypothetical protein
MKRQTQRRLVIVGQLLTVIGLALSIGWNLAAWQQPTLLWWPALLWPLPGLLLWPGALLAPRLLAQAIPLYLETYRLVYDAPAGWSDEAARAALRNLSQSGVGLDIIWAREGEGVGCWLAVAGYGEVLERLVRDTFPSGSLEADAGPMPGMGVVILAWREFPPTPAALCRLAGIAGVYYRRRDPETAIVAVWGEAVAEAVKEWARPEDMLAGQGPGLLRPGFRGDNPWPALPEFPSSAGNPGLAAMSGLERLEPALRARGPALVVGYDAVGEPVGFAYPDLAGLETAWLGGQVAEQVAVELTCQAVQAGQPVMFLDGRGTATTALARRLLREIAAGQALLCDVERPAQSRFRLNPLWLPADPAGQAHILADAWPNWLRELGVTPGGLGQAAYRHTLAAVLLTAWTAARQSLALDAPGLRDALAQPDFLRLLDERAIPAEVLGTELHAWWLAEGRRVSTFDAHLRLGHLRERLSALLALPEYGVLWRGPYLDPLAALNEGICGLLWRLPDPRRRLRPYLTSQLLALAGLLATWPAERNRPILIILHEVEAGAWTGHLAAQANARLIVSRERIGSPATLPPVTTLLVSKLTRDDVGWLEPYLPEIHATDLRRLPPSRLVVQRGRRWGTVELNK